MGFVSRQLRHQRLRQQRRRVVAMLVVIGLAAAAWPGYGLSAAAAAAARVQTPAEFFGFEIGADGELARYPKVLEYLQLLARTTDRVRYQEIGKTTMGNAFSLVTIS